MRVGDERPVPTARALTTPGARTKMPRMSAAPAVPARASTAPTLDRRLGLFDLTMIVMGGIIGSGIFMNPAVVARILPTPALMLSAWVLGGALALAGAFIYAELGARRPRAGGQYAYLRESYHPLVAFLYAWTLLLVVQSGGMAAVSITFARYARELTGVAWPEWLIAATALVILTAINCLGVRAGSTVQNGFMVLKIAAIGMLIVCGAAFVRAAGAPPAVATGALPPRAGDLASFGIAMVPVLFAYGGWQTSSFVGGEVRDPRRTLPRGLVLGVLGVVTLYVAVNVVCLRVLGPDGLAATHAPATDVMRAAFGATGARLIALGIALSTLGFLSQSMLTAPRVYYAMAADGLFFRGVARIDARTHAPVVAIVLQGAVALVIALVGRYEQILNYMVGVDWIFFTLTATCVFALRRRDGDGGQPVFRVPGHPLTTIAFVVVGGLIVIATVVKDPVNSLIGIAILAAGIPAYLLWARRS
jgi:basic amino acid/polyamine antiporter, APA family